MAVWQFAQLYGGAALMLAALVMLRYIVARSAGADFDTKKAFRPLYLVAFALLILGFGSITIYLEEVVLQTGLIELGTRYVYLLSYAVGVIMIGVAAVWILNNKMLYVVPMGAFVATIVLILMAVVIDPDNQVFYEDMGSFVLSVVLVVVGVLFAWIAKETQRGTSASLAYAFIAQIGTIPRIYELGVFGDWSLLIIFFMMVGPALVIYAFLKSDIPPTFELVGYGAAFSAAMLILASVSDLPTALPFEEYIILIFAAFGAMLCLGTAAYLFGRWRQTRQTPTLLYMIAFGAFYLGQMMGIFGSTGVVPDPIGILLLFDFIFAGIALSLLATAAILATGRGNISLIPFVLLVPVITVMWVSFEGSVGDLFFENILLIIPALVAMLLPVPIFLAVWWRMRTAGSTAAGRPLGMAVGIVLFFLARIPPLILGLPGLDFGYGVVASSFFVSWLAITGRLNRAQETQ